VKHRRAPLSARTRSSRARELALIVFVVTVAALVVRTFVVAPFSIPSGSMERTLQVGDRILVDRATYRLRDVKRGDVVVFDGTDTFGARSPAENAENTDDIDYVKRVIALGGDRVTCCDRRGRLTVNGDPVDEHRYLYPADEPSELLFDVAVPEGRLWVMGDHRSDSQDSRAHLGDPGGGTIPTDDVIGRVLGVVWPPSRLGRLP
jgi:signal peptidase I